MPTDDLEWVTNESEDVMDLLSIRLPNDDLPDDAFIAYQIRRRAQFVWGEPLPQPGSGLTVADLRRMGLVGLYRPATKE